jgi:hypothetical protein
MISFFWPLWDYKTTNTALGWSSNQMLKKKNGLDGNMALQLSLGF